MKKRIWMAAMLILVVTVLAGCAPFLNTGTVGQPEDTNPGTTDGGPANPDPLPGGEESPTNSPVQENQTQKAEFLDVIGANTPEDVVAALGEPEEIFENENAGYLTMDYYYPTLETIVNFEKNNGSTYLLACIQNTGAASPFTICGVSTGMILGQAEDAFAAYGLYRIENVTDEKGSRYYQAPEGDDPYAPVAGMTVDGNGQASSVTGYSGLSAQWALNQYATLRPEGQAPPEGFEEQVFEPDDFLYIAGSYSPDGVAEAYGVAENVEEDEYSKTLHYPDMTIFFDSFEEGPLLLDAVTLTGAGAPVGVGGAQVGMTMQDAQAILESNGYVWNQDIYLGAANLFYDGLNENGDLICFVELDTTDGTVTEIRGFYGTLAFNQWNSYFEGDSD